jgi:SNF2-related domain
MQIHNGAVLLQPGEQHAAQIRAAIPRTAQGMVQGQLTLAVKHKLEETLVLRNLGFDIPSPIAYGWKYPGMYAPRDNQRHTSAFMTLHKRAFILNDMRTGKTYSALWGAEYLLQEGFIRRVLVVCPKSCMHDVWENALFECLPHRSSIILHGDRNKRLSNLAKDTDFCIINHDGITALSKEVTKGKSTKMVCEELLDQFDLIIYDEADVLCNHRTKLYKAFESLIQPNTWLWLMTGTPTPNQYADAWGLLKLVVREVVYQGRRVNSWTKFRELVMYRINQYKWGNKYGSKDILFELMQPAIRFTKAQCFDAKEVKPEYRTSEMTAEQKKAYWQMQKDSKVSRGEDDPSVVAKNAAVKLAKLLQISMGAVKDEFEQKVSFDSRHRLNTLKEVLHEAGVKPYDASNEEVSKKSIVFMPYKYTMEDVHAYLTKHGYRCTIVNGDVGDLQRRQRFAGFKGKESASLYEVLIAHPEVTAHGLDLTVAESIIWYAPCYGNRLYAQGNERIQGAVQKGDPAIFEIVCTKLEKERFEALKKGSLTQSELLAMYERALEEEI